MFQGCEIMLCVYTIAGDLELVCPLHRLRDIELRDSKFMARCAEFVRYGVRHFAGNLVLRLGGPASDLRRWYFVRFKGAHMSTVNVVNSTNRLTAGIPGIPISSNTTVVYPTTHYFYAGRKQDGDRSRPMS